ncbi:GDSL-type esterase/lipase family protein [Coprobacillus cateniformis]|uniref:GDSL-type esterase/lipase family protein n=1 Tax=Coprobacillus cateniformis TaxID=100884 RepID=UPI0026666B9F|nr:GDSL-type esterase/lipase family protein [Coprobacillus cateniformis]
MQEKKGQTLNDIINKFDSYKNEFNPKAMAYMIGKEDYSQDDVNRFKEELREFITLSLELRNQQGFAVIQKPHTIGNVDTDAIIEKYCGVVDEVVEEFTNANNDQRIVVVEHDVTDESLKDGVLNQKGHYNIGQQLSEATIETTSLYPCTKGIDFNLKNMNTVETYAQDIVPSIQSTDNSLEVEIPEYKDIQEWVYTLTLNDKTITDIVGNEFVISPLEKGSKYSIKIQSKDGKVQIRTMSGVVGEGQNASVKTQSLDSLQEQLKNKMDNDDSLTWLFMGDSITHGSAYSLGQDTIAQSFEKYLRDDLKRTNDIVVNTAVSGATIDVSGSSTLATINERLNSYSPDIVSIMLGTNDSTVLSVEQYRAQLQTLINKAKAKTDIVVLRSPLPTQWDRDARCREYTQVMKEVASEMDCIFIDQYTPFHNVVGKYPYMYQDQYFVYGDNCVFGQGKALHPGANGHLMMTKQFIEGIGILDEDTFIPNLFIKMPFSDREDTTTNLTFGKTLNSISFDTEQLSGVKDIKLTVQAGTKKYEVRGDSGILKLENLPSHQVYKVSVSGCSITKAELISYILQDIELTDKEQLNELIKECDKKDLSEYTTSSKEIFEEALASAKTVYKKTNPTIKEIDDAMTALNDAIEQLVKPSQLEVELDNDLLVDDIDQFKLMIRNDVKAQAIIKEASDKGQKIVVKLAFVEQRQRARMRIENKLGIYSLKALLMVDDEEVYEFDNTNTLIKVTIDIPDQLLNDEVKSFYLVKNIEDEYPKVAFERNGNKITFNGQVGSQYSFIYEKKEDGVEEPSQDDNKPNHGNTNTQVDNNKQHSLFVNKVQTSDEYQSELYIVLLAAALIIPIILKKKEGITNEKESND